MDPEAAEQIQAVGTHTIVAESQADY